MLERTLTSLGHVVGWRRPHPNDEVTANRGTERRIWVRYPCDVEATCQPADSAEAMRLSARVRNISRGGIHFLLNCPVEAGSLVSVELPGAGGNTVSTVLAYVVRVAPDAEGEWSVGCTFATELQEGDLEPFGVGRVRPRGDDQRAWTRFPCDVRGTYGFVKADGAGPHPATVVDMSATGVRLTVERPIELGKLLNLQLRAPQGEFTLDILACVVRVTPQDGGRWTLGCNLIRELSPPEFKALLAPS
jgi:hypothetical protein